MQRSQIIKDLGTFFSITSSLYRLVRVTVIHRTSFFSRSKNRPESADSQPVVEGKRSRQRDRRVGRVGSIELLARTSP
jgi:hypothetical protein